MPTAHKLVPFLFENVPLGLVALAQAKKHFFIFFIAIKAKKKTMIYPYNISYVINISLGQFPRFRMFQKTILT